MGAVASLAVCPLTVDVRGDSRTANPSYVVALQGSVKSNASSADLPVSRELETRLPAPIVRETLSTD